MLELALILWNKCEVSTLQVPPISTDSAEDLIPDSGRLTMPPSVLLQMPPFVLAFFPVPLGTTDLCTGSKTIRFFSACLRHIKKHFLIHFNSIIKTIVHITLWLALWLSCESTCLVNRRSWVWIPDRPNRAMFWGLPWWRSGKESTFQCRRYRFNP